METTNNKPYLDKFDIMKRYGIGQSSAEKIIRCVKALAGGTEFKGGGALPKGKVLSSELENWEKYRGQAV